jgi:hypothetical protein
MLQINKIKIVIRTSNGDYGFEESFSTGLNFIASNKNTCGKSSILASIYYCLGFEEIIGGKGDKILTSVYKSAIEDGDQSWPVLESFAYLEISNGKQCITIYRTIKMENRDSKLITVYFSDLDSISSIQTKQEDMYVHLHNSAINQKGFHSFLEKFIGLDLPLVPTADDSERKLYLQLIFSCMFIEQKRGWSGILSSMPYLGIRDSKKRVIEFILALDTFDNARKKNQLSYIENSIKINWNKLLQNIALNCDREQCIVLGVPSAPQIIDETILSNVSIVMKVDNNVSIETYIEKLKQEYDNLNSKKPKIIDNFEDLQLELQETEGAISKIEQQITEEKSKLLTEQGIVSKLTKNIEIISTDIINNKDAEKLKKLGASIDCLSSKDLCPVCHQTVQDSLVINKEYNEMMSIEANIKHLKSQKEMLTFALESHKKVIVDLKDFIKSMEGKMYSLRRLAKALRNDLYTINDDISETLIQKRLEISNKIEDLIKIKDFVNSKKYEFKELSDQWAVFLNEKELLPTKRLSKLDGKKIKLLENNFISNLKKYGYKSILNLNEVAISDDTYLPIVEGFDMKFDSSASDNIRAIWSYTMALMQTSEVLNGNHPNALIIDEPDQHSIVIQDMEQFFKSILQFNGKCQVFIAITIKDSDTRNIINNLDSNKYKIINISSKAFTKLN